MTNLNNREAGGPKGDGRGCRPSRFPSYTKYKDSGIDWLGYTPAHWQVTLVKYKYEVVLGKMLQPEPKREGDQLLPYLRAANIQKTGVNLSDLRKMWFSNEERKFLGLRKGDLLISEGGDVGRPAIFNSNVSVYFQNSINRVRPRGRNNAHFLYYWIVALKTKGYIDVLCNKSTIAHFTAEKVAALPLPVPSVEEQTQIARFLDHETARIDALIEEQQRLIELLKEKRQAVISHAVTKGLDPNVPMKDSGVEWLGEVPEHWDITQLKHVVDPSTSITYGIVQAGPEVEGGVPYIRTSDMSGDALPDYGYPLTSPEIDKAYARSRVSPGDLVISIRASVGKCLRVPNTLRLANLTQGTAKVTPGKRLRRDFLFSFLNSKATQSYYRLMEKGATFKEITLDVLRRTVVAVPPLSEQKQIEDYLSSRVGLMEAGCKAAEEGIALLRERRSALISAAVTGKIDVRNWQPDQPSATHAGEGYAMVAEQSAEYQ